MEYIPIRIADIVRQLNRDIYLPAIQREFVWGPNRIERLFDSVMSDFPIGSFLYWRLDEKHKEEWPIYEFIREFNSEVPHNNLANMAGINKDITLVLDGQQRITSLFIGLRGSYRYFYYRWHLTQLYLNLLKCPTPNEENTEEMVDQFEFRERDTPDSENVQHWSKVGRILDYPDAEDAKSDLRDELADLTDQQKENANRLIGKLHSRVHTVTVGNYYEEKSQSYDKVLQIFVRANSGGQPLEYSDLLLATATAKWETYDARKEIHDFTDTINRIGTGYQFGKDFVLKSCLYLTEHLPILYQVKNFNLTNLRAIENNWTTIKLALTTTVTLISRFGFNSKNIVAPLALLPIAFFLMKRGDWSFDESSNKEDAEAQISIRRWFVFATLKNAFGSSSDTTLSRLRELLIGCTNSTVFPSEVLYRSLGIEPKLNDAEIDRILTYGYQGRYTNLVLSLLYPDRDWKGAVFHEDHIFPQSEFQVRLLRKRGYDDAKIQRYLAKFNVLTNLELLTDSENLSKNATPFDEWLPTRDEDFKNRHFIPALDNYRFDSFEEFHEKRRTLIAKKLQGL